MGVLIESYHSLGRVVMHSATEAVLHAILTMRMCVYAPTEAVLLRSSSGNVSSWVNFLGAMTLLRVW